MENKKLNELKKERPSIEEQLAFIDSLMHNSDLRQDKLRKMISELKAEIGTDDADK